MKHQLKKFLRDLAKHFRVTVKFVSYLDEQTHGRLLVRERRILVNAHKPRSEHVFTILHEMGHFVLHQSQPAGSKHCPWFARQDLKNEFLTPICSKVRRYLRFVFNRSAGKEWEADLWALCVFSVLAKQPGCRADLMQFLNRHPEKLNTFLLVATVLAYNNTKNRLMDYSKRLLLPFSATGKL